MPTHYYDIYYIDGSYEKLCRYEDVIACKESKRKIKCIKEYKLTEKGWEVKEL